MDSGRNGVDGLSVPKRGSRIISRDSTKSSSDQNIQLCNRTGCSGRLNPATANLDKTKVLKSPSRCSAHCTTKDFSNGVPKAAASLVKPLRSLRTKPPLSSSSGMTSSDVQRAHVQNSNELSDAAHILNGGAERTLLKKPSSVVESNVSSRTSSSVSKSSHLLSRQNASTARPGSRYLPCSSVPNAAPSDSESGNRKQMSKRSSERESTSFSRVTPTPLPGNAPTIPSRSVISTPEIRQARSARTSVRDNVSTSVRPRRSDTSTVRRQLQMTRGELPTGQRLQNAQSATGYSRRPHNITHHSTTESSRSQNLSSPSEVPYSRNLVDREGLGHYIFGGITEQLLSLQSRLLSLQWQSNTIHGGLSFNDQHRDMRLDIDNMSYEELLALGERIGSVSTALSEDALAKCIKKSIYTPCSSAACFSDLVGCEDDTKCSICQEDYNTGDEMGKLHCKHSYHVACIEQWLRQKNWCPICKSSAAT